MTTTRRGLIDVVRTPGKARNALMFAAVVLVFFCTLDLVIVVSPDFGRFYVRNAGALLALGGSAMVAVLIVLSAGRILPTQTDEEMLGDPFRDVLEALGDFIVLQDVPTRRGAIPYALVGAHGIFLVDADDRGGKVSFDGKSMRVAGRLVDHSRCARLVAHARYLESLVDQVLERRVRVRPIYVFERGRLATSQSFAGVTFTSRAELADVARRSRYVLRPDDVGVVRSLMTSDHHAIVDAARPDIFSTPTNVRYRSTSRQI